MNLIIAISIEVESRIFGTSTNTKLNKRAVVSDNTQNLILVKNHVNREH